MRQAKIGQLAEQIRGVTYSKADASHTPRAGYLPVLRAGNIRDEGLSFDDLVFVPKARISDRQRIRRNDVLIAASSGSIDVVGKAARALDDYEGAFGAFCKILRPRAGVDPAYFSHYFRTQSYRREVSALAAGVNINNLRNEDLDGLEIPVPTLVEQRRIATILDEADVLRAKRRRALIGLEELGQAIFRSTFGDPRTNPRKFETERIGSVGAVGTGSTPSRSDGRNFGGQIPWVKTTEVHWETINDTDEKLTTLGLRASRCKVYPAGSVVVALYGEGKTRGQAAILGIPAATNQACGVIQPNGRIHSTFLLHHLRACYQDLRSISRGGNQSNLNLTLLSDFVILVPPQELQIEFVERLDALAQVKANALAHLKAQEALFASLQYRAFRGELGF